MSKLKSMSEPKRKTTTVHTNVDTELLQIFDQAFPACRRRFIENAIQLATTDKDFFDRVFFKDLLK